MRRALMILAVLLPGLALAPAARAAAPLTIVAAENVYGALAARVAGPRATVVSILSNPDQDPHLFEADVATARSLADARIVIANGLDYDPWMEKLLGASKGDRRVVITVGSLVGRTTGENPHVWYDPAAMVALAGRLAADLGAADAPHKAEYEANAKAFVADLAPLQAKIAAMRACHAGQPVTASEPVFGYMAEALGLDMRNVTFQTAVMNNTEPSPAAVAAFEDDLTHRKVRAMLYNSQADDQAVKRLVAIAEKAQVPVVGVSETEPAGVSYEAWMIKQLTGLDAALSGGKS